MSCMLLSCIVFTSGAPMQYNNVERMHKRCLWPTNRDLVANHAHLDSQQAYCLLRTSVAGRSGEGLALPFI